MKCLKIFWPWKEVSIAQGKQCPDSGPEIETCQVHKGGGVHLDTWFCFSRLLLKRVRFKIFFRSFRVIAYTIGYASFGEKKKKIDIGRAIFMLTLA